MKDKLNSLPIDALFKLKQQVEEACQRRRHELFKVGREATFETNKRPDGRCRIVITGLGPKNVQGYEIDRHGNHLRNSKWRCSPNLLTPVFDAPKPQVKPLFTANDRPAFAGAGSF